MNINSHDRFEELLNEHKPELKKSTRARYLSNYNSILRKLGHDPNWHTGYPTEFNNPTSVIDKISAGISDNTLKSYIGTLAVYCQLAGYPEDICEAYGKGRDILQDRYNNRLRDGVLSEKEEANMVDVKFIDDLIEKLDKEQPESSMTKSDYNKKLHVYILKLMRELPIRNELASVDIVYRSQLKDHPTGNILVITKRWCKSKPYLLIRDHKTDTKFGAKKIPLNDDMEMLVRDYLNWSKNPEHLISKYSGEKFTSNAFSIFLTNIFKKHLGKNISSQMLRKIILTDKYRDIKDQMHKDAEIFGHSVATQQHVYVK